MSAVPLFDQQPERDGEPVFGAPWQANAFALCVHLHERGLFTWPEWAAALARAIASRQDDELDAPASIAEWGERYYLAWLAALESLLAAKGLASGPERDRYARAWESAAARTPHGRPISLEPGDFDP